MELIQEIGSYAGFAAVIGLAVLSALYFSQARDVRRLRDWAGRAPERDAEARSRVAAAGQARAATPAQVPQQQPAAVGSGNNVGAATPAGTAAKAGVGVAAASAGGAAAARGGVGAPGRPAVPAAGAGRGSSGGHTQVMGSSSNGGGPHQERWYRRMDPRYIALIVAGVLVVGGGIAFGATQILSGDDSGGGTASNDRGQTLEGDEQPAKPKAPSIKPADVEVAVFNGTLQQGLGRETGDKLISLGFPEPTVGQAPEAGFKAESVVFYADGKKREARLVAKRLKISNIEELDDIFRPLAGNAETVVVIGQNAVQ